MRRGCIVLFLGLALVACSDDEPAGNSNDQSGTTESNGSNDGGTPPSDSTPNAGSSETEPPSNYAKAAQNIIDTLNGVADVVEGVNAGGDVDAAVAKLSSAEGVLTETWKQVNEWMRSPTPALQAEHEKWRPKYKAATDRLNAAMKALPKDDMAAMVKLAPAIAKVMGAGASGMR